MGGRQDYPRLPSAQTAQGPPEEDFTKMHASERKRPTYTELLEQVKSYREGERFWHKRAMDYREHIRTALTVLTDALENEGQNG